MNKEIKNVYSFINQWKQLFCRQWYEATLIKISFEKDVIGIGYEFVFILLGVGFRIRINKDCPKELEEAIKELKNKKGRL